MYPGRITRDCQQRALHCLIKGNATQEEYQRSGWTISKKTDTSSGYDERKKKMETLCDNLIVNQRLTAERKRRRIVSNIKSHFTNINEMSKSAGDV